MNNWRHGKHQVTQLVKNNKVQPGKPEKASTKRRSPNSPKPSRTPNGKGSSPKRSASSRGPRFSSSMKSDPCPSRRAEQTCSFKSSMRDTKKARWSSPRTEASQNGATPSSRRPSSTGSSTTQRSSESKAQAYRLRKHADLIPEHVRENAPITPPPPPKKRGRPKKQTRTDD